MSQTITALDVWNHLTACWVRDTIGLMVWWDRLTPTDRAAMPSVTREALAQAFAALEPLAASIGVQSDSR